MGNTKKPSIPGFTAVTDQIFVREREGDGPASPSEGPGTVLIYGWGDGLPKHVLKYADGYRQLFPKSRQVIVLSPIRKALFSSSDRRSEAMLPMLQVLGMLKSDKSTGTVLAHAMSNTGAIYYAATLDAFNTLHGTPMPHDLLVLDSTPGSPYMSWYNLKRWSRAMSLGLAAFFPWPFAFTQVICACFIFLNFSFEKMIGRDSAGVFASKVVNDVTLETTASRRLFLYSKADDLISWNDIEEYAAESSRLGYPVDTEMFEGSGHVGHMRQSPEQYWRSIGASWKRVAAKGPEPEM